MKIKFNWGTGITIFIILFIGFYIMLMVISSNREFQLVSEEYYPESLEFETRIEKSRNTSALSEKLQVKVNNDSILLILPDWKPGASASGTAYFYRPSNSNEDISYAIEVNDNGIQVIKNGQFKTGRYIVKVDWNLAGTNYYDEISIYIP